MLELRPNCECCDKNLPPASTEAMICTYECTFCADCVNNVLNNVCPNCGGGFVPRPIRPKNAWRPATGLGNHPAATLRHHTKYSKEELAAFSGTISHLAPKDR